jgi:16S rRNA (cytosine967-C5)-methyltransferase
VSNEKPREIAIRALQARETTAKYVEDALENELGRSNLSPPDRRLAQELAFGVVRWRATLDWLIAQKTEGGRNQKLKLQILLRLGLYQIFWMDRIPNHAAVHETVDMAKRLGLGPQAGFVNAVLRGYLREESETRQRLEALKETDPSLAFSHPDWLYQRWLERWGSKRTADLMDWNNRPPETFARVNTLRPDSGTLQSRWKSEGVEFEPVSKDWYAEDLMFELTSHPPLNSLATFKEGLFYIQDPSTLLAVRSLNPQPGESVLDLCAAPGGKTTFIAQMMENRGEILAQDISPQRLAFLTENCARLGVTNVETARPPDILVPDLTKQFDRVLVDAPCSNSGVMRRRVDLRWRIRPEEIERLRLAQLDLLARGASQVKPGGALVYSTCSLEPEENEQVCAQFLEQHRAFKLEEERLLFPAVDRVDGAYVVRFRKSE